MKVVIIEDEKLAANKLEQMLSGIDSEIEIVKKLESVEESVNWLNQNKNYDLIFMDIQLDDGISFEIFDAIHIETPVIFTTAYNEYAIRAFKVNSVDYLLKPVDEDALKQALEKFDKIYSSKEKLNANVFKVFEHLSKSYKERFFIKVGIHYQSVMVNNVSCFFVEERCTFLKNEKGKNFDLDYSLDQIQKMVNPDHFFRINRNFLVNIDAIKEILGYSSSRLKLKLENCNDENLIVSREKVTEFKNWMDR